METIAAKQVEGAVDNSTDQSIGGVKTFLAPVNFLPATAGFFACFRVEGMYLYWIKNTGVLDEDGNVRLGPGLASNAITLQTFTGSTWSENHEPPVI